MSLSWQNKHFNRLETASDHTYINFFGYEPLGAHVHPGFIKCKLAHGPHYSVIVPDQLFLEESVFWIQPLAFRPNVLTKSDDYIRCQIGVDVSCGHSLIVSFTNRDLVRHLPDSSELYRCSIHGPANLAQFATGGGAFDKDSIPLIRLYHHTTPEAKANILATRSFCPSKWNIQGTKRQLVNVRYAYLTALDRIQFASDLTAIAMASNGHMYKWVDGFSPPKNMSLKDIVKKYSIYTLKLPVYRASTRDRTATLDFCVDCSCLAPQHILRHSAPHGVWYEVCNPFTHRIGLPPSQTLPLNGIDIRSGTFPQKQFEYIIVGDATTVAGLAAPHNEEETAHIWKIEKVLEESTMLDFWMHHSNRDHFSGKTPDMQVFTSG